MTHTFSWSPIVRHFSSLTACLVISLGGVASAFGDIVHVENFNTDGEGTRYVTTDEFQNGAKTKYWTRNLNVFVPGTVLGLNEANGWQVVGEPFAPFPQLQLDGQVLVTSYRPTGGGTIESNPAIVAIDTGGALNTGNTAGQLTAPARRVGWFFNDTVDPSLWTGDTLDLFDSAVAWAGGGGANLRIGYVNGSGGVKGEDTTDNFFVDRLSGQGHDVVRVSHDQDPATDPNLTGVNQVDLYIISDDVSSGTAGMKYTALAVPLINYEQALNDELGISNGGATLDASSIAIKNPVHPLAAGLAGTVSTVAFDQTMSATGNNIAPGATVIARHLQTLPIGEIPQVNRLAVVDAMISGAIPSTKSPLNLAQADISDVVDGAGGRWDFNNPDPGGGGDDYAIVGTGQIRVNVPGTYHVAIGGDDGGRLRIDTGGDGIDAGDTVINDDTTHGFADRFGTVTFAAAGDYEFEWVGFERGGGSGWEFSLAVDPAIEDGNGPYLNVEGTGFFASADLQENGFDNFNPHAWQLNPVDVSGVKDVELTIAMAARTGGWDFGDDFAQILIDPDGDGPAPFQLLADFQPIADSLNDGTTELNLTFQDVTYAIPEGSTDLVVRILANSTADGERFAFDNIRITGTQATLFADLTGNGFVDFEDLTILLANWNQHVGEDEGNLVNAGATLVNFEDLTVLLAAWTGPGPAGSPEAALGAEAVPEPSGFVLVVIATLGLSVYPRRRRRDK